MKKIIIGIMSILTSISQAQAFDFSSIDPRLSSDRAAESEEESAQKSQLVRTPQTMTQNVEKKGDSQALSLKNSLVKIIAVVNGDIISTEDLDNRVRAFIMANQIPVTDENRNVIYQRVLTATIDEKLKLQEAEKNGIKISEKEIDSAIANFENVNKIPQGKMKNILKEYGVEETAFREQMKADLAWMRLIRQKSSAEGNISDKQVAEELEKAKKDFAQTKYQISEIFISGKNAKKAKELDEILQEDNRFEYYAFQFSEAPTASAGGRLGWVNVTTLSEPLQKALKKMKKGQISHPIKVGDDYYIIRLEQVYKPEMNKHEPTEKDIRTFLENQRLDTYATKYIQEIRQKAVIEFKG